MNADDRRKLGLLLVLILPTLFWFEAVRRTETLAHPKWLSYYALLQATPSKPWLVLAVMMGLIFSVFLIWAIAQMSKREFEGASFKEFLRGTEIVSPSALSRKTRDKKQQQIMIAGIPMPPSIETLHLLVGGSTGAGKSVLIRELVSSALQRGDRLIIADPNGDMLAKFGTDHDKILNPYDARSQRWCFFNEIRHDYDFKRFALSIVPRGGSSEEEEWASYGRLLLSETAHKLFELGVYDIHDLFRWTTVASPQDLKSFLEGTAAESLFVGADKALASARFVLSSKLSAHLPMTMGEFSLRDWLADSKGGNLFITWREDMAVALRPLISAWVDVLCTSILSLPESKERRIWMILDELASLEKLASLGDAATKGRKAGLRIVAGLQSTAQLNKIYGQEEAQTLRSCFRSLVVLGGAKTDPKTCEDMSQSLGEHEVERETISKSTGKNGNTNHQQQHVRERVVLPAEIAALPDLTGYVAFAGDYPIAKMKLKILHFANRYPAFVEKITAMRKKQG